MRLIRKMRMLIICHRPLFPLWFRLLNGAMNGTVSAEKFLEIARSRLGRLEKIGFKRSVFDEVKTPTFCSIAYVGNNVGFVFTFDLRDQCVGAEVVKVIDERLMRNSDGGYSSDIFSHLVRHEGYRGSPIGKAKENRDSSDYEKRLAAMIDGYIGLLEFAGQRLLKDEESSIS